MPLDPLALPLLLAGPVLRRVEADLVSVWIAVSRPCNVALLLFDGADVVASEDAGDDARALWVSALQPTLPIGAHLHILTVVLDLRDPGGNAVRSHGSPLAADQTFSYDLRIFEQLDPEQPASLRGLGLLSEPAPLGYDPDELPSFKTCPQELAKLVLVHGSCRHLFTTAPVEDDPALDDDPFEPPGGWPGSAPEPQSPAYDANRPDPLPDEVFPQLPKRDGMLWVDTLNEALGPSRIADRPHQLFLTGDQIYADQVPTAVLPAISQLARLLVGEEDLGADPGGATFKRATLENFPPAFRTDIVRRTAGFTTSAGDSHLLSFGEFVAYYLLTWSPALWTGLQIGPDDGDRAARSVRALWPDDFDPSALAMPEDWRVRFIYEDDSGIGATTSDYDTLLEQLPVADSPGPDASRDEHAAWFFLQRRNWLTDLYWSPESFEWYTRRFRQGLARVRRALANVPTYMVPDDHDISDDWYFSRQWREQVFTRPLGVDIIRNGMMACSLMQAWGNDPRRWATGPERELLESVDAYGRAMAQAAAGETTLPRAALDRIHELLGLPQSVAGAVAPTFRPLVEYSFKVEGPCHRVLGVDGRTKRRFPTRISQAGGIDFEGATGRVNDELPTGLPGEGVAGLFGDSPMAAALPPRPDGDSKLTVVVTGVPVIGPEGMEQALVPFQRFARLLRDVDAEAWSYEPATYEALLAALARYGSVVILSGDVHVGWSAALDYWSAPAAEPVRTARIVQLVSSGLTKDWGNLSPPLRNHALTLDVFEAATTSALMHAERIGWGVPLRTTLAPPSPLGTLVSNAERAHPFYRARLRMQAPVVPTHGWPAGTTEQREPNWAWRAAMARDDRVESTSPPTMSVRWTPVLLPEDPLDPAAIGWHAKAARRMAYGRVFAVNTNVGIVTFEPDGLSFTVQHVLAGELPPLADTGAVPTGLQPYIVHRLTLAPMALDTWADARPKLVDDGGWGVDKTEPALALLVDLLPRVWQAAAGFAGAVWADVPPVLDDIAREALLSDAATRVGGSGRRRIIGELGPFATLPDENLDAVTPAALAALLPAVGRLDVDREARALIRPDLERMLALHQSLGDPLAGFDDLLLLGCSDWVNERARVVTIIAGILVTFRSPVTRHVPVLAQLLSGLWDLWRNRTGAEIFTNGTLPASLAGLLSAIPRGGVFMLEMIEELLVNLIQDRDPRPEGGPPIFTPELALAGLGVWLGLLLPRRFTLVSGWEPRATPLAPGMRAGTRSPETLARQTLSLMIHPGNEARFKPPAQKVSVTLLAPPGPDAEPAPEEEPNVSAERPTPGSLLVGWDGGLETEKELGAGFRLRLEMDGRGFHKLLWSGLPVPEGRIGGASLRTTLLRPTRLDLRALEVRITPAVSLSFGVRGGAEEDSFEPAFTFRVALNDIEDRVSFVPDDAFLVQLLPTEGIAIPLDAALEWNLGKGWRFAGFAEIAGGTLVNPPAVPVQEEPSETNADLDEPPLRSPVGPIAEVVTPLDRRLGVLSIHERRLEVTTSADATGVALNVAVTTTLSTNIGPFRIAVSGLGLKGTLRFLNTHEEGDDLFDFSLDLPPPTGLAVSIDTAAVSGGGFIQRIQVAGGAVTWRGGLALRLGERLDASAFAVVETGGGRHWSLIAMLFIEFSPPVHLTAGLRLMAVGGLVALHRTMDIDALRDAATGTQGSLDVFMFPDRPQERFLELLPTVERFFPRAPGHQVFGLLAQFEWSANSGTRFGEFRLALLGEFETLQFALYGTARLGFPTVDEPHILRVRAAAEALYDHRGQFARFSLTLIEAFLFERVHLTGGCALLLRWGDRSDFALTLGGFHPSYRPFIPKELREPPRLGASWKPHRLVELSVQAYFARTLGSLQFGFSAHVRAGASWGGIRGDAEFNFLVMLHPDCRFELDLSFRVTAFLFGADLISAGFRGAITGPGPWHFVGSIYWEVCGVDLSKDLGPYEWGDSPPQLATVQQEARQVLGDALADPQSWTLRRSPRLAVRLRPGSDEAIDPRDQIDVRQALLPLAVHVEVHDANGLLDPGIWTLRLATTGLRKLADLTEVFPTRRYLRRPPKESPFRGDLVAGVRLAGDGWSLDGALAVGSDEGLTEDLVLDSLPVRPKRVPARDRVLLADAMLVAVAAQAPLRKWTRHALRLEALA